MLIKNFYLDYKEHRALPCRVPCSLYSVMLDAGLMDDPFVGLNEKTATDMARTGCTFTSKFNVTEEMLGEKYCELSMSGIDTIANIYLNGALIASVKNMHRGYIVDVKKRLLVGENELKLVFSSPIEYFESQNKRLLLQSSPENIQGASHLRKAICMSGWDWGPMLPDIGIYGKVELLTYSADRLDSYFVRQIHDGGRVTLLISAETVHGTDADIYAEIDGKRVKLQGGIASVTIDDPHLWWIRDYGEQYLYDISVKLELNGVLLDEKKGRIGLRTVTVSRKSDKYGKEFTIVLNGVEIFAKGANYIPSDNIIPRITPERIRSLLDAAVFANFNCMRVWGGGYYPEDCFYDICDEYGLLVWQDIMVACATITLDGGMRDEFREEAIYNIKRFRNHPSFGILCGNNEIEDMQSSNYLFAERKTDYLELYEGIIPEIVSKYSPDTFYWPSSPSSGGGFNDPNCKNDGDTHYWDVWHGEKPITEYRKHMFRFCSEFGFQSFPSVKTVATFAEEKDYNPFSEVMETHQKNGGANGKILKYLSATYRYPYTFEGLVLASQLLQAEAIKGGVEHFRHIRDCCKGAIYWQLNDCWPVASWSSVDYFGRYKPLHYHARRFFAPVLASVFVDGDCATVAVMNEQRTDFKGVLKVRLSHTGLTVIEEREFTVDVPAATALDIISIPIGIYDKHTVFISAELYSNDGELLIRQSEMLTAPKHFDLRDPEISVKRSDRDGVSYLTFSSTSYAKDVFVDFDGADIILEDNCFDLVGESYTVAVRGDFPRGMEKKIIIKSAYDIR